MRPQQIRAQKARIRATAHSRTCDSKQADGSKGLRQEKIKIYSKIEDCDRGSDTGQTLRRQNQGDGKIADCDRRFRHSKDEIKMPSKVVDCGGGVRHSKDKLKMESKIADCAGVRHSGDKLKMQSKIADCAGGPDTAETNSRCRQDRRLRQHSKQADMANGPKGISSVRTVSSLDNHKSLTESNEAIRTSGKANMMNSNRTAVAAKT